MSDPALHRALCLALYRYAMALNGTGAKDNADTTREYAHLVKDLCYGYEDTTEYLRRYGGVE